ncbi:MAG: Smr/MutS family protein [Spirochaetaceae bacterium]|nr:Smr/MutS family protein [Spirochaetaceae bacterium]
MDFKDILDEWERRNPHQSRAAMPKEADVGSSGTPGERRRRLLAKKPDAVLDLHGLTRDEAWQSLDLFFEDAGNRGFEKVLIVHGKGNHAEEKDGWGPSAKVLPSTGSAPLKLLVKTFIDHCPLAGESGYNPARQGGSGATWVLIKKRRGSLT